MGFGDAVKSGYRNYFRLSGTATRSEFWYFVLFGAAMLFLPETLILSTIHLNIDARLAPSLLGILLFLVFFSAIPALITVAVRRLHDTGRTGLWILVRLVVEVILYAFIFLGVVLEFRHESINPTIVPLGTIGLLAFALDILLLYFFVQPSARATKYDTYQ